MSSDEAVVPGAEVYVKPTPRKLIAKIHPLR